MKILSVVYLTTAVSLGACGDVSKFDGAALGQSSSSSSVRISYPFQSKPLDEFRLNPEAASKTWAAIREVAFMKLDQAAFDALYDAALVASRRWDKVTPISSILADQRAIDELQALISTNCEEGVIAQEALDQRMQTFYEALDLAHPPLLCSRYHHDSIISGLSRETVLEHEFLVRDPSEEEQRAEYAKRDDYLRRVDRFKSLAAAVEEERARVREVCSQRHREIYESKMSYVPKNFYTRQQDMVKTLVWDYIQSL
jgi:hypothetical protein